MMSPANMGGSVPSSSSRCHAMHAARSEAARHNGSRCVGSVGDASTMPGFEPMVTGSRPPRYASRYHSDSTYEDWAGRLASVRLSSFCSSSPSPPGLQKSATTCFVFAWSAELCSGCAARR